MMPFNRSVFRGGGRKGGTCPPQNFKRGKEKREEKGKD